jgi:hypothetical protein
MDSQKQQQSSFDEKKGEKTEKRVIRLIPFLNK